jgi:hypothetical protein
MALYWDLKRRATAFISVVAGLIAYSLFAINANVYTWAVAVAYTILFLGINIDYYNPNNGEDDESEEDSEEEELEEER